MTNCPFRRHGRGSMTATAPGTSPQIAAHVTVCGRCRSTGPQVSALLRAWGSTRRRAARAQIERYAETSWPVWVMPPLAVAGSGRAGNKASASQGRRLPAACIHRPACCRASGREPVNEQPLVKDLQNCQRCSGATVSRRSSDVTPARGAAYGRDISHSCRSPASTARCNGSIVPAVLSAPNTGLRQPHEQTAWTPPSPSS
jgi:hypothetical protein